MYPEFFPENEVYSNGDPEKMVEHYTADALSYNEAAIFKICFYFDDTYLYAIDSALMYMSQGGLDFSSLQRIGIIIKEKYLKQLQDIHKRINGKKVSKQTEANVE